MEEVNTMFAMKCDRCGEYFDSSEAKITGGNCDNEDFGNISVRGVDNFCCKYDLCDTCVVEFFRWMNDPGKVTGGNANE